MLDERLRETQAINSPAEYQPQASGAKAVTLRCAGCGNIVNLAFWQPVIKCPHCQRMVYPDRSLRNLLPLGWDCPQCNQPNDGLANFCVRCGAGLASRCLRCESPVTGPVCLQCGEHQAHLRQLQNRMASRAAWVPIQRERVEAQLAYATTQAQSEPPPSVSTHRDITPRETRRQERAQGRSRRRGWGWNWGWWPLAIGVYFIVQRMGGFAAPTAQPGDAATPTLPAWAIDGGNAIQGWWAAFLPTLDKAQSLTPKDAEYAIMFAALMIGVATLPMILYLIHRVVARLFP